MPLPLECMRPMVERWRGVSVREGGERAVSERSGGGVKRERACRYKGTRLPQALVRGPQTPVACPGRTGRPVGRRSWASARDDFALSRHATARPIGGAPAGRPGGRALGRLGRVSHAHAGAWSIAGHNGRMAGPTASPSSRWARPERSKRRRAAFLLFFSLPLISSLFLSLSLSGPPGVARTRWH